MKKGSDKVNVLCVPCWYPDPSGVPPRKGVQIREHTKAAHLYENINLIVLRNRAKGSRNPGIRRYSSGGVGIIDIMPPSTGSVTFNLLSKTLLWHRGLAIALKTWGKPDVIHAQDFSSFHAVRSACAMGIPSVVSQYWSGFHDRLAEKSTQRKTRRAFNRAKVILSSSVVGKRDLRQYGIRGDIRWIPSSINTRLFTSTTGNNRNRDLFHFSNFSQNERVADIIEAFSRIQHLYPESVLHLAGEGGWKHELVETASRKLKSGTYSFPGSLTAEYRAEMLRTCCGFVYPSINSFHSVDLIEAMACRCPSIATEHSLKPFNGDPDWILQVRPGRIGELARQMKRLLDNTHNLDTKKIQQKIHEHHSREYVGGLIHQAHLDAMEKN